jgi:hypothetical protein
VGRLLELKEVAKHVQNSPGPKKHFIQMGNDWVAEPPMIHDIEVQISIEAE